MEALIRDVIAYSKTGEYFHSLLAGLTILVIQIVLLSIAVPITIQILRVVRTRRSRVIIDFYIFQVFHKITRMFLSMASVEDVLPIVLEEQQRNPSFFVGSHPFYGNLENILFALDKVFREPEGFRNHLEKKSPAEFATYLDICDRCFDEIDRLIAMVTNLPQVQRDIFKSRILIYVLRDGVSDVVNKIRASKQEPVNVGYDIYELQQCASFVTGQINVAFKKKKKLSDSVLKNRQALWIGWLVATTPFVVLRRWFLIRLRRLQNRPYEEPHYYASLVRNYLLQWRQKNGFTLQQAAAILEMPETDYRDFEYGYRVPPPDRWGPITKHLRGEVDYSKFK